MSNDQDWKQRRAGKQSGVGALAEGATTEDAGARIRELEHLLELERARRVAIEQGLDRLSERLNELAHENAELRLRLGEPEAV